MKRLTGESLIVRADAGPKIGAGHFMRCVALGQAWADAGGSVTFVTASHEEPLLALLEHEGFEALPISAAHPDPDDASRTAQASRAVGAAWVVIDGYSFDEGYYRKIGRGRRVLWIDDTAQLANYPMDVVLNQNAHASLLRYRSGPRTTLLLGTEYVLLRREFRRRKWRKREVPEVATRLMVTLGAADPGNATFTVIEGLNRIRRPNFEATVVLGPANPARKEAASPVGAPLGRIRLESRVKDMAGLMEDADLAIASGGTVVWELAHACVPTLVVETAPHEQLLVRGLDNVGLFRSLGRIQSITPESIVGAIEDTMVNSSWRAEMSLKGRRLVDGKGCERVMDVLLAEKRGI